MQRLILTGTKGNLSFGVRTSVGSALLSKLSEEANFAERDEQFTVYCRDSHWCILARKGAKNATLLNGKAIKTETRLRAGDVISLGNASGEGKQVMRLNIGLADD